MAKRSGSRGASRDQGQARGRERTATIRQGLSDLEVDWGHELMPGAATPDRDMDDQTDGDLSQEEAGDEADVADQQPTEGAEADHEPSAREVHLTDLLGSRPPIVLVRILTDGDRVGARTDLLPPTPAAAESLGELRGLLAFLFHTARQMFDTDDWARLIGTRAASPAQRLVLLSRLAVAGNASVEFGYHEKHGTDPMAPWVETWIGEARTEREQTTDYRFTPNDRGQERYVSKFAALPDGTPFSIRLLLLDKRGRPDNHPFKRLPLAVKLQALRSVLDREQQHGQVFGYERFREELQRALDELGIAIDRPTWAHVKNLFETLARAGLGKIFPDGKERQRRYDEARAAAAEVAP